MFETFESVPKHFVFPDIQTEKGEFERVAQTFNIDVDTLIFLAKEEGKLLKLTEETWKALENTDSNSIQRDGWETVQIFSESQDSVRDWQKIKHDLENKIAIDAPIIMKLGETYHLVAGNTRLMVARAAGITPDVLLFEYIHDRTNEKSS